MNEKELRQQIEQYINDLQIQELEEKIAPVDCAKKPQHPDCRIKPLYGVTPKRYGGPF